MRKLSPRSIKRLREIVEAIKQNPDNYDQDQAAVAACGTPGCIFGWALALYARRKKSDGGLHGVMIYVKGSELLDLPHLPPEKAIAQWDEATRQVTPPRRADRLFYREYWPEQFKNGWTDLESKEQAVRAAARIEHFIKTNGRE
jgi:hypothetical protein